MTNKQAVKKAYKNALYCLNNEEYEDSYNYIISAIDNFDTQYGSDFHLEYIRKDRTDLLGDYNLEVFGVAIRPSNFNEHKSIIEEGINNALNELSI